MQAIPCSLNLGDVVGLLRSEGVEVSFSGNERVPINHVSIDSRKTLTCPGLFVPLKGAQTDGHAFVARYLERHKDNVSLCARRSQRWDLPGCEGRVVVVPDVLEALQALARAYRKTLNIDVVGISGSCGKTSFKQFLAQALKTKYDVFVSPGNLNNHIGVPLSVLGIPKSVSVAIVELGINHPNEMDELVDVCMPTIGVVTNVGRAHLGFFESVSEIATAKSRLFSFVQDRGGKCFGVKRYRRWFPKAVQSFVEWVSYDDGLGKGRNKGGTNPLTRSSSLLEHGVSTDSFALALEIGKFFGVSSQGVWDGLKGFGDMDHGLRGKVYESGGNIVFLDCYNASPDSFLFSLKRARHVHTRFQGKTFVGWYGDMAELGTEALKFHRQVLEAFFDTRKLGEKCVLIVFGSCFKSMVEQMKGQNPSVFDGMSVQVYEHSDEASNVLKQFVVERSDGLFFHVKGSRCCRLETAFEKHLPESKTQKGSVVNSNVKEKNADGATAK